MLIRTLLFVALLTPLPALAQLRWQEGVHYTVIANPRVEPQGNKIELTEVFSFGCVHCYRAKDNMAKLRDSLPADAVMNYVHASFLPAEAWPMFQRAWYTAEALGIGETLHDAMFVAVWESGEIPLLDAATGRIRTPLPTIDSAAKFYARLGSVKAADFLKTAQSPAVDAAVARADELIKTWRVGGTPALVVNGRYLIDMAAVGSWDGLQQIVTYLIGLERQRLKLPTPAPAKH